MNDDVRGAGALGPLAIRANVTFDARRGRRNLWIVAGVDGRDAALRVGHGGDDLQTEIGRTDTQDGVVFEFASALGALRGVLDAPAGTVHAAQRGLRSGIVFASTADPSPRTLAATASTFFDEEIG